MTSRRFGDLIVAASHIASALAPEAYEKNPQNIQPKDAQNIAKFSVALVKAIEAEAQKP